jgi:hypothetical protein
MKLITTYGRKKEENHIKYVFNHYNKYSFFIHNNHILHYNMILYLLKCIH